MMNWCEKNDIHPDMPAIPVISLCYIHREYSNFFQGGMVPLNHKCPADDINVRSHFGTELGAVSTVVPQL